MLKLLDLLIPLMKKKLNFPHFSHKNLTKYLKRLEKIRWKFILKKKIDETLYGLKIKNKYEKKKITFNIP